MRCVGEVRGEQFQHIFPFCLKSAMKSADLSKGYNELVLNTRCPLAHSPTHPSTHSPDALPASDGNLVGRSSSGVVGWFVELTRLGLASFGSWLVELTIGSTYSAYSAYTLPELAPQCVAPLYQQLSVYKACGRGSTRDTAAGRECSREVVRSMQLG